MAAAFPGFPPEAIKFLQSLKRNNRREWFQPRKHLFDQHLKEPMLALVAALNVEVGKFAPEFITDPKKAIFRIYRDTRFSSNKTPYKTNVSASFARRDSLHLKGGGFYFSVSPDEIEVAGGIYHPEPEIMRLVRTHISETHEELAKILANKKAKKLVGELQGAELTRAPKGFDPAHPAVHWIKKKDWILDTTLDPALATSPQLCGEIADRFRAMAPLIIYLNRAFSGRKKQSSDPLEFHR